jgi:hypothetical protein
VIERPGRKSALVEIKSAKEIGARHLAGIVPIAEDLPECQAFCLSQDPQRRKVKGVLLLPWQEGLAELGLGN